MNKESLYTTGKKLTGKYGTIVYIMSVFDLEPSGVIVQGYNQMDSKEHILPIAEKEVYYNNALCYFYLIKTNSII
jgi:hypothetical protein